MLLRLFEVSLIVYMFCALGEPGEIFGWYQRLIDPLPLWLAKPLGACFRCFTGQVCFWFYLITYIHSYNVIDHLFFASAGIFLSILYNKLWAICE